VLTANATLRRLLRGSGNSVPSPLLVGADSLFFSLRAIIQIENRMDPVADFARIPHASRIFAVADVRGT
jgi:hypothetical protein